MNAGKTRRRKTVTRPLRGTTLLLVLLALFLAPCNREEGPAKTNPAARLAPAYHLLLLSTAPTEKFADLGESDDPEADFDHPEIRLEGLEGPAWESYWTSIDTYRENPGLEDGWFPYADREHLPAAGGWIGMRLVRGEHMAQFYADSQGFELTGGGRNADALYLTIRYKDINFDPALDRFWGTGTFPAEGPGVSVNGCSDGGGCGDAGWFKLGSLGGAHDFAWKTETLEIPAQGLAVVGGGEFKFRVSPALWGRSDLYGEIAIDWIRLSEADRKPAGTAFDEPYHVSAGFWPDVPMNPAFAGFAETGFLHEGQPFFPLGLFVVTTHFYWESDGNNYLTNARDTGFNFVIYNGWEAHSSTGGWFWGAKDDTGIETFSIGEDGPSAPYPARFLGLPDFLARAEQAGLMVAPWWTTDMWRYYIRRAGLDPGDDSLYGYPESPYDGTFGGVVEAARQVVLANKDHPAILMWFIKDEADHLDEYWGSPVESVRWMYKAVTGADGAHPCLVNNMGWRPLMFRHYKDTFDIGAFDRYTSGFDGPVSHDQVAEWAEEFKVQTEGERMFMAIVETEQLPGQGRFNDLDTVRIAAYLALVHGAQGLLFFDDPGPNADLSAYSGCGTLCGPLWWDGLAEILAEVNTLAGTVLHNALAETLGTVWGESHGGDLYPLQHTASGDGTTDAPRIHALFRRNLQTRERILIAVNACAGETTATFSVAGLDPGDGPVEVLFEGRAIAPGAGTFSDHFAGGERHVYRVPGSGG